MGALGGIVPYAGAKRHMAPNIVRAIGPHKAYWEVPCGSLAVLLEKPAVGAETVCDRYGDLTNLARCLAGEESALDLYGRVSRFLICESVHAEAAAAIHRRRAEPAPDLPDTDRAVEFLAASWWSRSGHAGSNSGNGTPAKRYTSTGGAVGPRWQSVIDSIPDWHHRLRNVLILNEDCFKTLDRIEDRDGTVIYCDPPYVDKKFKYIHDFKSDDHDRLATALGRFRKTRVVLSYYDDPLIRDLYPGDRWSWTTYDVPKHSANQGGKTGGERAEEVLITNYRRAAT